MGLEPGEKCCIATEITNVFRSPLQADGRRWKANCRRSDDWMAVWLKTTHDVCQNGAKRSVRLWFVVADGVQTVAVVKARCHITWRRCISALIAFVKKPV